jgi:hypothetical protein
MPERNMVKAMSECECGMLSSGSEKKKEQKAFFCN